MAKKTNQFIVLCFFILSFFFCYSLPLIFFPRFAKSKHNINEGIVGIIFALFPIGHIISAFATSKLILKYPTNWILLFCSIILGIAMIGYSFLIYIENYYEFIAWACIMRFLQGAAAGIYENLASNYVAFLYPEQIVQKSAIVEILVSTGLSGGSLVGAGLYKLFNFQTPFIATGILYIIISPVSLYLPTGEKETNKDEEKKSQNKESISLLNNAENNKLNGLFHFLCTPKILFTYGIMLLCFSSKVVFQNNLSMNLKKVNKLNVVFTSIIFSIPFFSALIVYLLYIVFGKNISKKKSLFFGGFCTAVGMLLIGPEVYIFQKPYISVKIIGLILAGSGFPCIMAVIFAELIDIGNSIFGQFYEIEIISYSSALIAMGFSIGELIGSVTGGYLVEKLGFSHACSICSIAVTLELIGFLFIAKAAGDICNCFIKNKE